MTDALWQSRKVTVGEIAEIAGVTSGAVSNWRRRHEGFPGPVEETSSGDLFELGKVVEWLEERGKKFDLPRSGWAEPLWRTLNALRDRGPVEDAALFALQLLLLAQRSHRDKPGNGGLAACWERIGTHEGGLANKIEACLEELGELHPRWAPALRVPSTLRDTSTPDLFKLVESLMKAGEDPSLIATDLLRRMETATGRRGGDYFTPDALTRLHVRLLEPIEGTVYDPAAGSAMALVECWRRRGPKDVRLCGQDVNRFSWSVGTIHLALAEAEFKMERGDTLRDDRFIELRADRITADAPFFLNVPSDIRHDERWSLGMTKRSANWLWVQVVLHHLAEEGRAVVTTPMNTLFAGGQDRTIRKKLLETNFLDAVIELPPGLYENVTIPVALLILDKDRSSRAGEVLFIDGRQLGQPRRGRAHELADHDIDHIVTTVESWRCGDFTDQPRFASAAKLRSIEVSDVDLTPKRYIRYATRISEIEGEGLEDRLERLRTDADRIAAQIEPTVGSLLGGLQLPSSVRDSPYERIRIGDALAGDPTRGARQQTEGTADEVPYVETRLVSGGAGILREPPSATTRSEARGRMTQRGDVLLTSRGIGSSTPAEAAVVDFDQPAAFAQSLLRLTPDPSVILPEYLLLFLRSRQGRTALSAATTGSVISNLRPDVFKEIELPLPPLRVQEELRDSLRAVLDARASLQELMSVAADAFDAFREAAIAGPEAHTSET